MAVPNQCVDAVTSLSAVMKWLQLGNARCYRPVKTCCIYYNNLRYRLRKRQIRKPTVQKPGTARQTAQLLTHFTDSINCIY